MCGIFFAASPRACKDPSIDTINGLESRGPDSLKRHDVAVSIPAADGSVLTRADPVIHLTFVSSVLALRGSQVQVQPLIDVSTGSVFCWNGEAWRMDGSTLAGNDTTQVFQALLNAATQSPSATERVENVLTEIAGPYAFVFYHAPSQLIYFGRDRLGRRSLMILDDDEGQFTLASTATGLRKPCKEVDSDGIFRIDLKTKWNSSEKIRWNSPPPTINRESNPPPTIQSKPSASFIQAVLDELEKSLRLRVTDIPAFTHFPADSSSAKVAILFSGGLDCTLLARMVHDILPTHEPIDLLNVAFENPRTIATKTLLKRTLPYEFCPDRTTGRASHAELVQTCPTRPWRFVAIDVPFSENCHHRQAILNLMYPHNTEMDLSIATALYFAARGQGWTTSHPAEPDSLPNIYTTTARVLLSGLGADEIFGGYTRHATAFSRRGYAGLADELELDFGRIGSRNLGRDDRVMGHWGKEVRYPYLDEEFVDWALGLPAWEKCGFRAGKAIPKHSGSDGQSLARTEDDLEPAKMLLRLAAWRLGMKRVAGEKKRAIQFGARTAKMEVGGNKKGTDLVA